MNSIEDIDYEMAEVNFQESQEVYAGEKQASKYVSPLRAIRKKCFIVRV